MVVALLGLSLLALVLTVAMFATRNMLLGFPSAIFWGIFGAYAYQQSYTTWDWQYILFFGAMGMTIFCMFAAFALRKRDLAGPDADKGAFVDEGKPEKRATKSGRVNRKPGWGNIDRLTMHDMGVTPSRPSTKARERVQERAKKRKEKIRWGEFG